MLCIRLAATLCGVVILTLFVYCVAPEVKQILEDERTNLTSDSSEYWVLAAALKQFFTENSGQLPVEVVILTT